MPWDTNDYPASFKNLDTPILKKAIDIANAMIEDGYDEDEAIPISITQAKKWAQNASDKEKNKINQKSDHELKDHTKNPDSRPELMKKGQQVLAHEKGWAVQAEDSKQPSEIFNKKDDAIARAREIAQNKETHLIVFNKDGSISEKTSYDIKT